MVAILSTLLAGAVLALAGVPPHAPAGTVPDGEGAWPLHPGHQVVHRFDPPDSSWGPGHRGVDLLGRPGQAVRASLPGTVSFASALAGRGVVVVDHGGFRTTYEPVAASVSVGERVGRGEVIGTLQLPRSHCFPRACLHWGLIRGGHYLDPLSLVGAGPVRLLPMASPRTYLRLTPAGGQGGRPPGAVRW